MAIPTCSDCLGLCCWISDVLYLHVMPGASLQMHLGINQLSGLECLCELSPCVAPTYSSASLAGKQGKVGVA